MPSKPIITSTAALGIGYFGKIPSHGDFVGRGLPPCFVEPWDAWLSESIATSRQQLGDSWLSNYLTSPIYYFVLSEGVCGSNAWTGLMMPSVDSIGRYFSLVIAAPHNPNESSFKIFAENYDWYTNIEQLALKCLEDDYSSDNLHEDLSAIQSEPLNPTESSKPDSKATLSLPHAWRFTADNPTNIPGVLPDLMDLFLQESYGSYSIWWTNGSEHIEPSLLISEKFPPIDNMTAMLDGNWIKWGWKSNWVGSVGTEPK